MTEATKYANDIAKKDNDDALDAVRKSGKSEVFVPSAEEKASLKKILVKVHQEFEGRIGKDLIQSIYKETGFKM